MAAFYLDLSSGNKITFVDNRLCKETMTILLAHPGVVLEALLQRRSSILSIGTLLQEVCVTQND